MRYINKGLALLISLLYTVTCCQKGPSPVKFIDYQEFESAYQKNSSLDELSKDFDLLPVLLLDSAYKQRFFTFNPDLEDEFTGYSNGLRLNESTVSFFTRHTDIKKVFDSPDKIFNCLRNEEDPIGMKQILAFPIYVKNNTAIVTILKNNGSDTYYFKLNEGVVQINWLGGILE
jgi:hypothetical protein